MEKQFYFQKTHDVDKEEFARLLKLAKGGRTLKDFAQICGVVPSTFTRITQGLNKGASSTELLEAIARNAVPSSGVTLQMLAAANGYTVQEQKRHVKSSGSYFRVREALIRTILCQELVERQKQVRLENGTCKIGKSTTYKPDVLISTDAFIDNKKDEFTSWYVEYILNDMDLSIGSDPDSDYDVDSYGYKVKSRAVDLLSRGALLSMIANKRAASMRFSLVVIDQEAFDIIVRDFGDLILDFDVTLILVDLNGSCIVDEFLFSLKDAKERTSFFMTKKTISYEFDDYEERLYFEVESEI